MIIDELIVNQASKVKHELNYLSDFICYYAGEDDRKKLLKFVGDAQDAVNKILEEGKKK